MNMRMEVSRARNAVTGNKRRTYLLTCLERHNKPCNVFSLLSSIFASQPASQPASEEASQPAKKPTSTTAAATARMAWLYLTSHMTVTIIITI